MTAPDVHLIFPPQWSPFQPFLSTPSLAAYLNKRGHSVVQSDWNLDFYDFFIAPERLGLAIERLERYVRTLPSEHEDYRNHAIVALGILSDFPRKHQLVERLRTPACLSSVEDFYASVTAFKRLLHAFSVAEPIVEVGTSSLTTADVLASTDSIDRFCQNEETNPFLSFFRRKVAEVEAAPRYFGLSVIGGEQILASLTLAKCLRERFPQVPVVVGGSVFSRLVDKGGAINHLFENYIDLVVRYEGERPLVQLLESDDPRGDQTSNLAFLDKGEIIKTALAPQIGMEEIPAPDFSGLDLDRYYTPEVVLPLLTTRGCYWDKCAFCYHGMIYGDRYRMRQPEAISADLEALHSLHGVRHFAFNDEAIPPKLFGQLADTVPNHKYYFTALYKFEKYYTPDLYKRIYDVGFRSLYIGLETANERVQRHMRKNNTQRVMLDNLRGAHEAGIWNHTFNFFGFPTETHDEALDTARFLIDHSDIIHSEGTGTFSFEHNAPISKDPATFGVTAVKEKAGNVLELYYDYEAGSGLSSDDATAMVAEFTEMKRANGAYQYSGWIPREHLLVLLSHFGRDELRQRLEVLDGLVRRGDEWPDDLCWFTIGEEKAQRHFVVNSLAGKILETNRDAVLVLEFMPKDVPAHVLSKTFPVFHQLLH